MGKKCPKCQHENPDDTLYCGKCATRLPFPEEAEVTETLETPKEELTTGSTFAERYQIIEELGKGGMGRVYKVLDNETNEKIALKLIKPEIASDKKTIERFKNELTTSRKIRHKNVCGMYYLGEDKGRNYITMEFVSGEDLKSSIRRFGNLPVGKAISIAKQICDGLEEAHSLGIVHRDLKPNNIMIDDKGNARIMDFGIARTVKEKGITSSGVMIGTPEYMSPEQVEAKEVDQRSDIYSLGIIMYEMLTGRLPFEADTPFAVGIKHKSEIPKVPNEYNAQIPDELSGVILKCLEKVKEDRYQDAREVRSEMEKIEQGLRTSDRVTPKKKTLTSREITVKFKKRKVLIPVLTSVMLLVAALSFWLFRPRKETSLPVNQDKPSLAIMYFKNNTGDQDLDHWRTMLPNLLVTDLTQSKHLRILAEDKLFNILIDLGKTEAETYSSDVLAEVAEKGRVSHILQGAYAKAGNEFRINVTLQDTITGELISSESVSGQGEESIFSLVDELTRRVKTSFNLTQAQIASDIDKEVGTVTTRSPEAYIHYVRGIGHDITGEYKKVIESMQKAVAIDPDFASAYNVMSWAYSYMYDIVASRKCAIKALELSTRLPDRERYRIQGNVYLDHERTYAQALEALSKLVELYPDDISGNNSLGNLYSLIGDLDSAALHYEAAIQSGSEDVSIYTNLASNYSAQGLYDKAVEICQQFLEEKGDSVYIRRCLTRIYNEQGRFDLALVEAERALRMAPQLWQNIVRKGEVHLYRGELEEAEAEFEKLLLMDEREARGVGLGWLIAMCRLEGRFQEALHLAEQALLLSEEWEQPTWIGHWHHFIAQIFLDTSKPKLALEEVRQAYAFALEDDDPYRQRVYLVVEGLVYLEMKAVKEAEETASRLKRSVDQSPNKKNLFFYEFLQGNIHLSKKNIGQAQHALNKGRLLLGVNSWWHFPFADALAKAYLQTGDLDKSASEFHRAAQLKPGVSDHGPIYARSFYYLGQIYEKKGVKNLASENYRKFLFLWKDADSGLLEVDDAKKRLAGLKNH